MENISLTVVSLNTDSSEGPEEVREYATENGFDWRFADAFTEVNNELISEFGPSVTEASNTPITVVCDDGDATSRSGSVTPAGDVQALASDC